MKHKLRNLILLAFIAFIGCYSFFVLIDKMALANPDRIERETGLMLPEGVRIIATKMSIFSLADGKNFEWLLVSDSDLKEWIEQNMKLEGGPTLPSGGWANIKSFGEVSQLAENEMAKIPFSGVWKSVHQTLNGKTETAYLYVAQGNRVAQLCTFRP